MPQVGVLFELRRAETLPGEVLRVTGARPELGAWDPRRQGAGQEDEVDCLRLATGALSYPRWSTSAPVWIYFDEDDAGDGRKAKFLELQYKFLKDLPQVAGNGGTRSQWEDRIENRHISLPQEPGSLWLVSDALWNWEEPAQVSRLEQDDLIQMELESERLGGKAARTTLSYCLTPCDTPGCGSEDRACYDIEEEFEALSTLHLPSLLLEKMVEGRIPSELASEVLSLRHESAMLDAEKEAADEEVRSLQAEVSQLRSLMEELDGHLEGCFSEHAGVVRDLREENARLREQNSQLRPCLAELQAELREARAALLLAEASATEGGAEVERLQAENAELQEENEDLQFVLHDSAERLCEAKGVLEPITEEAS